MIVDVPDSAPHTVNEPDVVATELLLLLHTPPGTASDNRVLAPTHKPVLPEIGAIGLTLTIYDATQVPPSE